VGKSARFVEFFIKSHARTQNRMAQTKVCHHGPIGIGKRIKRSHLRQPSFFHQRDGGSVGGLAGSSIAVNFELLAAMLMICGLLWHRL
jgi:hypothetical protein